LLRGELSATLTGKTDTVPSRSRGGTVFCLAAGMNHVDT
jgi:hypothetical protein